MKKQYRSKKNVIKAAGAIVLLLAALCLARGKGLSDGSDVGSIYRDEKVEQQGVVAEQTVTAGTQQVAMGGQETEIQQIATNQEMVAGLTFKYPDRLTEHYEKHGVEMGFASEGDYLKAANAVITNPESLHKLEAEDGDDVYFLESTNEIVFVSKEGFIRTYFIADGIEYFDRQ